MNPWDPNKLAIRVMKPEDLEAIVEIDSKVLGGSRREYYQSKLASALDRSRTMVTSLVATYDGKVAGFVMGELYHGEFGIPESTATIDTIGVHPDFQNRGVATFMAESLFSMLKGARVDRAYILVKWDDWDMLKFFAKKGFVPGRSFYLEKAIS